MNYISDPSYLRIIKALNLANLVTDAERTRRVVNWDMMTEYPNKDEMRNLTFIFRTLTEIL